MPAAGGPGTAGAVGVIAVGIGVSLGQRAFPAGLAERATSVLLETGKIVERDAALAALLEAFDGWRAQLERDRLAPVRARWLALAGTIRRPGAGGRGPRGGRGPHRGGAPG